MIDDVSVASVGEIIDRVLDVSTLSAAAVGQTDSIDRLFRF